jgi:predicted Zn-dependent protease
MSFTDWSSLRQIHNAFFHKGHRRFAMLLRFEDAFCGRWREPEWIHRMTVGQKKACLKRPVVKRLAAKAWLTRTLAAGFAAVLTLLPPAGQASAQELSLIRDAETEALIADYTAPIFRAAGVSSNNIKVHLVNDTAFNAFVVDGRNMFINTGAILQSETPNQLIGVIAHETGHITGGHITGLRQQIAKMQTAALMLQALSLGAVIGGATTGHGDAAQAGTAMMFGGEQVLMRSLLSYRRAQESAADQAGVEYLTRSQQSPAGMLKTFRFFADQSIGSIKVDPYIQTHPVAVDRIAQLQEIAQKSPFFNAKDSAQLQLRHDLVKAKIVAYTYKSNPKRIARQYSDNGLPAKYARAITTFFTTGYQAAAPALDELIAAQPQNPWFYELKGTFLRESGKSREAVGAFRKAVSLMPKSGFMKIELAQAILESDGSANEALQLLGPALINEDQSWLGYRLQSEAYGKLRRFPEAELASALANFHIGDIKVAKQKAESAKRGLPEGSPGWVKADDIVNFKMEKVRG